MGKVPRVKKTWSSRVRVLPGLDTKNRFHVSLSGTKSSELTRPRPEGSIQDDVIKVKKCLNEFGNSLGFLT